MDDKWKKLLANVDYAFQPIVNINSGRVYACEALIRNYESEDFHTIDSVFDTAFNENLLYKIDMKLRKIAIKKFASYKFTKEIKLFYNLDNRITLMPDFVSGKTCHLIHTYGLDTSDICFELSEKQQPGGHAGVDSLILNMYKQQGYKMAIDDFGVGFSGFQMLYKAEPDFIKIDIFFITDIDTNKKKQLFVRSIVEISQAMGISVIAEGVETLAEFEECKRLGCNMIQGYFVTKPIINLSELSLVYKNISELTFKDRRNTKEIENIDNYLEYIPSVHEQSDLDVIFEYLRDNVHVQLVPIVSHDMSPVGIIKEVDLKEYIYSRYGLSLLKNQTKGSLKKFIVPCGVADVNDSLEKMLKIYSYNSDNGGIIITKNNKYLGYLSANVILDIVNKISLIDAKDQNPLSGLPGNKTIDKYISNKINFDKNHVMVYFDFDNFKPFNDYYGFRNGDRVISLFANILKKENTLKDSLVGHIGGDDFFLGWSEKEDSYENIYATISRIVKKFAYEVESFYDEKDRMQRHIVTKDRNGILQKFPLMGVSAAILSTGNKKSSNEEVVAEELSKLKKIAKNMDNNIAWSTFIF